MKLIPACYCSDDHDKGEESWNINNIYVYVCVYICVCVCVTYIISDHHEQGNSKILFLHPFPRTLFHD